MIFVTVGTQNQQFIRLMLMVEKVKTEHSIIIQAGETKFISNQNRVVPYVKNFDAVIEKSDIIITHGGVGTIVACLQAGKKVIVVPRLAKYQEHVDDHQLEIAREFAKRRYCLYASNLRELQECLDQFEYYKFVPFASNNQRFNNNLNKIIDDLLN